MNLHDLNTAMSETKPTTKRRRFLLIAGLAAIAITGVWVLQKYLGKDEVPAERPESIAPANMNGTTLRFEPGATQLSFIKTQVADEQPEPLVEPLSGRITYDENRTARVSAPIAARVAEIDAQLGAQVKQGQLLALLDAPDYAQAVADARKDELEVRQKKLAYDRAKLLYDGGVLPRKEFESAETDLRESDVELARARKRLEALGQNGVARDGRFQLRAPVAGVVMERNINPGTQVGPDTAKPLFVISDPAKLTAVVYVPEHSLAKLKAGQDANVESDAYPGKVFPAKVVNVGDVLDPDSRRVQVRCEIENAERLLKPEMFVRVTPIASSGAKRVRVPNGALVALGVKNFVFVEREAGVFERREVAIATQGRDYAYLKDGLKPGEHVVASGALLLSSELQGN